jgi:hypothetical protein
LALLRKSLGLAPYWYQDNLKMGLWAMSASRPMFDNKENIHFSRPVPGMRTAASEQRQDVIVDGPGARAEHPESDAAANSHTPSAQDYTEVYFAHG